MKLPMIEHPNPKAGVRMVTHKAGVQPFPYTGSSWPFPGTRNAVGTLRDSYTELLREPSGTHVAGTIPVLVREPVIPTRNSSTRERAKRAHGLPNVNTSTGTTEGNHE